MTATPLALARLQLGGAAVLSPTRAAELLPIRVSDGLRWLRERQLVRDVPGLGEVVVWADVLGAIVEGGAPREAPPTPPGRRGTLRRGRI